MKKLLLFFLTAGISLYSANSRAASEPVGLIQSIRIKPSDDPDYPYCCMRKKWFFTPIDQDAQGPIYEGHSKQQENVVSRWRLKKTGHNWAVWMIRIS